MKTIKVKLTFTDELLGAANNDPLIHKRFIASKAESKEKTQEEVDAISVDEEIDIAKTVFPRMDDGTPFLYDYQIKGFFKDACGSLRTVRGTLSSKAKTCKTRHRLRKKHKNIPHKRDIFLLYHNKNFIIHFL